MGRQDGVIKINGQVGGISFYKSKDNGYLARQKGGISASRLKHDPAFARTRENGVEFGRAGKASKALRTAFRNLLVTASDSKLVSRLTRDMFRVVQSDAVNIRGERTAAQGNTGLLSGFEFNQHAKLAGTFLASFEASADRVAGTVRVAIPEFVSAHMVVAPPGATHFKLISGGAEIDFGDGTFTVDTKVGEPMPLSPQATPAQVLTHALPAGSTKPLFLVFGVEFYQYVNGEQYPLKNGAHNALAVVLVSQGS